MKAPTSDEATNEVMHIASLVKVKARDIADSAIEGVGHCMTSSGGRLKQCPVGY